MYYQKNSEQCVYVGKTIFLPRNVDENGYGYVNKYTGTPVFVSGIRDNLFQSTKLVYSDTFFKNEDEQIFKKFQKKSTAGNIMYFGIPHVEKMSTPDLFEELRALILFTFFDNTIARNEMRIHLCANELALRAAMQNIDNDAAVHYVLAISTGSLAVNEVNGLDPMNEVRCWLSDRENYSIIGLLDALAICQRDKGNLSAKPFLNFWEKCINNDDLSDAVVVLSAAATLLRMVDYTKKDGVKMVDRFNKNTKQVLEMANKEGNIKLQLEVLNWIANICLSSPGRSRPLRTLACQHPFARSVELVWRYLR